MGSLVITRKEATRARSRSVTKFVLLSEEKPSQLKRLDSSTCNLLPSLRQSSQLRAPPFCEAWTYEHKTNVKEIFRVLNNVDKVIFLFY